MPSVALLPVALLPVALLPAPRIWCTKLFPLPLQLLTSWPQGRDRPCFLAIIAGFPGTYSSLDKSEYPVRKPIKRRPEHFQPAAASSGSLVAAQAWCATLRTARRRFAPRVCHPSSSVLIFHVSQHLLECAGCLGARWAFTSQACT